MNILYFNEIDTKGVSKQYNKVIKFLQKDDFKSAEVKKIINSDFFRAKLDYENRLLFKMVSYGGVHYILILEIIFNHEYEKSKFLRGVRVDESRLANIIDLQTIDTSEVIPMSYLNTNKNSVHFLDKVISFDDTQDDILYFPPPVIIIGSAGSGKTALSLEKLKMLNGNVLYTSLSSYLVENACEIYFSNQFYKESQEIDFLSFDEFIESIEIPHSTEMHFVAFDSWFNRYKQSMTVKESYKVYEEFKGVLTGGVIDKNYLSKEEYLSLGIKQSIFNSTQREEVYELFTKYLFFLKENNYHDINIISHDYLKKVEKKYDFVFIDEVQDLTNIQLFLILSSLKKKFQFVLSGDSNQIVHPNFFSWSHLKTMLFQTSKAQLNILKVLQTNYRNSPKITELANTLLKIKNLRFGSIDKESTYLINSISENIGSVNFYKDSIKLKKELNKKIQKSAKFAILVMDNSQKEEIKKYFRTPLVFSIQEAKGLEYDNIILVNFISSNQKEFRRISEGVESKDLERDLEFSRLKDKGNKELEVYKFYINSLYVAFTRAIENLYIIEVSKKHRILELLGLIDQEDSVKIEVKQSTQEEWKKEAQKLKKQGKLEQSEAIEKELNKHYISKIIFSPKELELLKEEAFNQENFNKKAKDKMFAYAKQEMHREYLKMLGSLKYKKADNFLAELEKDFKVFHTSCVHGKIQEIKRYTEKYNSLYFTNEEGLNGLMIASMYQNLPTVQHFLDEGMDKSLKNNQRLGALEFAFIAYTNKFDSWYKKYRKFEKFDTLTLGAKKKVKQLNEERIMMDNLLDRLYDVLHYPYIKYQIDRKMMKVYPHSMQYFLLIYLVSLRGKMTMDIKDNCLNMNDFMKYITNMPSSILPDYRRKRQYVNSILANNEVNNKSIYNKQLFLRRSRGCYDLNPEIIFS
jgi:hypothetical protein